MQIITAAFVERSYHLALSGGGARGTGLAGRGGYSRTKQLAVPSPALLRVETALLVIKPSFLWLFFAHALVMGQRYQGYKNICIMGMAPKDTKEL